MALTAPTTNVVTRTVTGDNLPNCETASTRRCSDPPKRQVTATNY